MLKSTIMKKLLLLFAVLATVVVALAQKKKIQELTIGDRLPDLSFTNVLNHPGGPLTLSSYKGKVIILDLMKTNCPSCIEAFPKLQALQKQFDGKLQIIVATTDTKKQWEALVQKNKLARELTLPVILNDSLLSSYFRYYYSPHEVWLDGDRIVKATTAGEYIKASNIQQLLDGKEIDWVMKNDVGNYGFENPLVQLNEEQYYNTPLYYSVLSGHRQGTNPGEKKLRDTTDNILRRTIINASLLNLFKRTIKTQVGKTFDDNRFVIEVKDPSRFILDTSKIPRYAWDMENTYCYELAMPLNFSEDQFKQRLRSDLETYLSLHGFEDRRRMKCYVLQADESAASILASFEQPKRPAFRKMREVEAILNLTLKLPVIDETGISETVNLPGVTGDIYNLEDVRKYLAQFGIKIIEAERELDVFVIREN